jgi:putative hydrolase of the HAD superfamily
MRDLGIRGAAFDLDGTLYANYKLYIALIPFVFREWPLLGAFFRARRRLHKTGGPPVRSFYDVQAGLTAGYLGADPAFIRKKLEVMVYRGWENHFARIRPFPRLKETLSAFREAGLRVGLLSDFPPQRKLELLGLDGFFDAAFSTEDFGALKPASGPFRELAAAMGLPPEQILYVGNSPGYDVEGAKNAGMKAALIRRGILSTGHSLFRRAPRADFVFGGYRQLREYVLG